MKCEEFLPMLDAYIDEELDAAQRARLLKHAEGCPSCQSELRRAEALKRALADFDGDPVVPLPAQAAWRQAIKKESRRRRLRRVYQAAGAVAAALVVLVGSTFALRGAGLLDRQSASPALTAASEERPFVYYGEARAFGAVEALPDSLNAALETDGEEAVIFGASANDAGANVSAAGVSDAEEAIPMEKTAALAENAAVLSDTAEDALEDAYDPEPEGEALLVRSALREIYTSTFDSTHAQVRDLTEEYEGFVLSDSVTSGEGTHRAEMVAAVPREDLDSFLTAVDYLGDVARAELYTEDITLNYYDAEGRLEALAAERDRLQELMAKAESAEELSTLSTQLDDVFARIDSLESDYRAYISELDLSRVTIVLIEGQPGAVGAIPDEQLGQRMRGGFSGTVASLKRFFGDMAVSLAVLAPVAAIAIPVIALVWFVIAVLVKRHRRVRDEEFEE